MRTALLIGAAALLGIVVLRQTGLWDPFEQPANPFSDGASVVAVTETPEPAGQKIVAQAETPAATGYRERGAGPAIRPGGRAFRRSGRSAGRSADGNETARTGCRCTRGRRERLAVLCLARRQLGVWRPRSHGSGRSIRNGPRPTIRWPRRRREMQNSTACGASIRRARSPRSARRLRIARRVNRRGTRPKTCSSGWPWRRPAKHWSTLPRSSRTIR